jgi:hypothetical protein
MKTHISGKVILFFSFTSILIIACSKEDDNMYQVTIPSVKQQKLDEIGAIVDNGIVNPGTRFMETNLYEQYFTLKGTNEEVSHAMIETKVAFYVNSDEQIPSGEYSFSDSKTPFTFDSGSLIYSQLFNTKIDQITGGTITVNKDGDKYILSFQIQLQSGMTATQIYEGSLVYKDSK